MWWHTHKLQIDSIRNFFILFYVFFFKYSSSFFFFFLFLFCNLRFFAGSSAHGFRSPVQLILIFTMDIMSILATFTGKFNELIALGSILSFILQSWRAKRKLKYKCAEVNKHNFPMYFDTIPSAKHAGLPDRIWPMPDLACHLRTHHRLFKYAKEFNNVHV